MYEGRHLSAAALAASFPESVLVCGSLSKTFAMTGWRIGFALGDEKLIATMGRIVSHSTTNVCSISQRAALAALSNPEAAEVAGHRMVREYAKRRDFLIPALNALPGVSCATPGGALYAFPDVSSHFGKSLGGIELTGSAAFAKALLETVAVAVTPGAAFGEDRCIRLSFATSRERLEEGVVTDRRGRSGRVPE